VVLLQSFPLPGTGGLALPSPQPEDHGDKSQGRSPPSATSAPKIELDGTLAMPVATMYPQPEVAENGCHGRSRPIACQ
jgi:hypothetical protein